MSAALPPLVPTMPTMPLVPPLPPAVHAVGFSLRKRPLLRRYLQECKLSFPRALDRVPAGGAVAVWGSRALDAEPGGRSLIRVEDGFLRSVGLGADLVRPLSWVVDTRGIYYDATRPSDLEVILQQARFSAEQLQRAARLRARIVAAELTKYNTGRKPWRRPPGRTVVLVPGQVETDAAIRLGSVDLRTNLALLQAVRAARPRAHLVYKPHPDVLAGLRAAGSDEHEAARWCDEVVADVPMATLLRQVDEVHVLTSLAGFEALLRDKPVWTYGQPFYSGWGLTADRHPLARRTRRLTLDELVAGALLVYPRYANRRGALVSAEQALDELVAWRERQAGLPAALAQAVRWPLRRVLRWTVGR